jgi:hypothetical protein
MFTRQTAPLAGVKGGKAKTLKKQRASRANGRKGGRRASATLVESLLGRRIEKPQMPYVEKAFNQLFQREKQRLQDHFLTLDILGDPGVSASKLRRQPKDVRYIIQRFRLAANYFVKDVPLPKDYVVETQHRSEREQAEWEKRHPGMQCPPQRIKRHFYNLPQFGFVKMMFETNQAMTPADVKAIGGSSWNQARAEGVLAWLKSLRTEH